MQSSTPLPDHADAIVVGAGLAGLSCAKLLHERGVDVHVVDADDDVGGRVRTDEVDGFRLDRGFQVLLTAYEEIPVQLDLACLQPRAFDAGSLVWTGSGIEHLPDPFRHPARAFDAARARVGGFTDKLKVAQLRGRLLAEDPSACFDGPERSTAEELAALGFSERFVDSFFRPFLGGVFLERALTTSASLFRYYMRCFAAGDAIVPAKGMQRIPEQLAKPLEGRITLQARVSSVEAGAVRLESGDSMAARHVIVATGGAASAELFGTAKPTGKACVTSYFAAPEAPVRRGYLVLDGEGSGPVNHMAVMSNVAPEYAPEGAHLISVSGVDAAADDPERFRTDALPQLRRWLGDAVDRWDHLRTYRIADALPEHPAGSLPDRERSPVREDGVVLAGDHTVFGAIQGALVSGRRAAEAVLERRS